MADDVLFDLSTQIKPPKKFKLDGEVYDLLGIDHLSADDEAKAMALFARHGLIAQEIELTSNTRRGAELALKLKATRVRILCTLTTMPQEVADKLSTAAQAKLLEAIQQELAAEDDDEDEKAEKAEEPVAAMAGRPSVLDDEDETV